MILFRVSLGQCRKIKALLLLAILSVSEGRRVSANILANSYFELDGSAGKASSLLPTIPTATVRDLSPGIEDPELRKHWKLFAEAIDAMLTPPKLLALEHLKAIMQDPGLEEQSKLLAAQIKALAKEPKVQEWRECVTEAKEKFRENRYLQEHAKLASEQLSAIMDENGLWQQSKLFVEQLEAMTTAPKVRDQDLQERAKVFSDRLRAMMGTPRLREHSTLLAEHIKSIMEHPEVQARAKLVSAGLKSIMEDQYFVERIELVFEQSKAILEHPVLQEHLKLFAQQIDDVTTASEVKEYAGAAAEHLDAIIKDPRIQEYAEAIKAHQKPQKTDGGPTPDMFSLIEANRSNSRVSFVPPSLPGGKPVAIASRPAVKQVPRRDIRTSGLRQPRGRQPHSGIASDASGHPFASARGIRSMMPSLVNALSRRARGAVMSAVNTNKLDDTGAGTAMPGAGPDTRTAAVRVRGPTMQEGGPASPIPGVQRPDYLDGTLAGDLGLDPLNFVTKFSKGLRVVVPGAETTVEEADPAEFKYLKRTVDRRLVGVEVFLGPNTNDTRRSLMWYREAEIKHARLAMLAAVGWPLAELWHGPLAKILGAKYLLDVSQGRSLSLFNGGLGEVAPFLFLAAAAASAVEVASLDQVNGLTATGMKMKPDGSVVMKSYTPGQLGFDPLGLYGAFGSNLGVMEQLRAQADPKYAFKLAEDARKEMETVEITNGRLAMLAITGFSVQEFFWGTPVVDQTPLFFTFFGDVLAPGSLESLGLF